MHEELQGPVPKRTCNRRTTLSSSSFPLLGNRSQLNPVVVEVAPSSIELRRDEALHEISVAHRFEPWPSVTFHELRQRADCCVRANLVEHCGRDTLFVWVHQDPVLNAPVSSVTQNLKVAVDQTDNSSSPVPPPPPRSQDAVIEDLKVSISVEEEEMKEDHWRISWMSVARGGASSADVRWWWQPQMVWRGCSDVVADEVEERESSWTFKEQVVT
ncbi:hypothetical protein EJB05_30905, partial [Eragrostis curvula]